MGRRNYASKADCWAVGVIMYGMFSQKFPFMNETEVKHKTLQIHSRVCKEGKQLVMWALERDETKRCEASVAAEHAFHPRRTQMSTIGMDVDQQPCRARALEM